jgi:hypothetical protein
MEHWSDHTMTTIDGRWILLAALLGALALIVPAVTAGGTGAMLHGPSVADGADESTTDWPATHHHGPHHPWNGTDSDEYWPHHDGEYGPSYNGTYGPHPDGTYGPHHDGAYGPHHGTYGPHHDGAYGPHHDGTGPYRGTYGPHHDGSDGPNDAWNGTRGDATSGQSTTGGNGWGHHGPGC